MPKFNHAELDLHLVFVTVQSLGGYEGVTREKRWKRVCEALGQDLTTATSAGHTMRKNYEKVLLEFEVHLAEREGTPRVVPDAIDVANPALANDWNGNEDGEEGDLLLAAKKRQRPSPSPEARGPGGGVGQGGGGGGSGEGAGGSGFWKTPG